MERVPLYLPPIYQDSVESGRIIMRDGSVAHLRLSNPLDEYQIKAFFHRISPESRWDRFLTIVEPDSRLVESLCNSEDPRSQLTLVITRTVSKEEQIIGMASYYALDNEKAEVAFTIDDAYQGKGLGTLLLERLAVLAASNGFRRFWAVTHPQNRRMIEVFHHSGFQITEKLRDGSVEVEFTVTPTKESVAHSEMLDRVFTAASIRPIFNPSSVAVIGASRNKKSIGFQVLHALRQRYKGKLFAINPNAKQIDTIPSYASIADIPENIDLAVLCVPKDFILHVVDECGQKGVRALIAITAGFAEAGKNGRELQQALVEKVRGHGMRLVGPNCLGVINTDPEVQLNASFSPVYPITGNISMSSQSGALGIGILEFGRHRNLGFSTFISVGNKADVSGNDLLNFWEQDPRTEVILLYLESFGNARRFSRIARRVSRTKPIVCVKAGRTLGGTRAAGSHTAAIASNEVGVEALFQQTGVIRAETLEEMFHLAAMLSNQPLPRGKRIGIITNAGGPGILCTDACESSGLTVPEFSEKMVKLLQDAVPFAASLGNPVDLIAAAEPKDYKRCIEVLLESDELDALIIIYIPVTQEETKSYISAIGEAIYSSREKSNIHIPIAACLMTESLNDQPIQLKNEKVPAYLFPESAARVIGKVASYAEWKRKPVGVICNFKDLSALDARSICDSAIKTRGSGWLTSKETRDLLKAVDLKVPAGDVAASEEDAVKIARTIGYPVALKLASHTLIHKSEIGGVQLNLTSDEQVRAAFQQISKQVATLHSDKDMDGVLVQPMFSQGIEVIIGMTEDPLFGPLIGFGIGGIFVEVLHDIVFRIAPFTDVDAKEMVQGIKGYKLIKGYRGHKPADEESIHELLLRVSRLVEQVPEISEIDLNPVLVMAPGEGYTIIDARIHVRTPA